MAEIERVAIVTGAAGGIGRAMVQGLLAAGTGSLVLRSLRRARAQGVACDTPDDVVWI
jgi:NAD(P)-dependent dehydrogenase (short-subunit alcohol dehydrogenase family)